MIYRAWDPPVVLGGGKNHEIGRHSMMMMMLLGVCAAIDMLLEGSQKPCRFEVVEVIYNGYRRVFEYSGKGSNGSGSGSC